MTEMEYLIFENKRLLVENERLRQELKARQEENEKLKSIWLQNEMNELVERLEEENSKLRDFLYGRHKQAKARATKILEKYETDKD